MPCSEISLYNDSPADAEHIKNECKRLRAVFPVIKPEFIAVLADRIIKRGMTVKQLTDSIDNLLDNFQYQHPTVADIVSYDRKVKLYTYQEAVDYANKCNGYLSEIFTKETINGQVRWILR